MSLFITFEGGEGSGKSSQSRTLYHHLSRIAIPAVLTYEPGGTPLGVKIARLVKWETDTISPLSELLLFNSARSELVSEIIKPALENGKIVICDRYTDSTIAYQGFGRELDINTVTEVNKLATGNLVPDFTLLLDIPVEVGFARKSRTPDRFEQEGIDFHERVRQGYLKLAASDPQRWLVLDACKSRDQLKEDIWQKVRALILVKLGKEIA